MEDSIFTKIIRGEIPGYKIYEDDLTLAFLDIHPKTEGHTLVVPKKQVEFAWDLDDEDYRALMETVKKVANKLRQEFNIHYVGEMIAGIDVPHTHVHVFPFTSMEEYRRQPDMNKPPDHAALTQLANKLAF